MWLSSHKSSSCQGWQSFLIIFWGGLDIPVWVAKWPLTLSQPSEQYVNLDCILRIFWKKIFSLVANWRITLKKKEMSVQSWKMEHKLCGCPNDIPTKRVLDLPPRPSRISEPHFKIGGRTSPGRFSRHFYNLYGKEDERSDSSKKAATDFPTFYVAMPPPTPNTSLMTMRSLSTSARVTLSPVREHPAFIITVIFWPFRS